MFEYRLANLMGLSVENTQHSVCIKEAMFNAGEHNLESFYEFCVDHKNGIEFETKTERLITLSRRFKKNLEQSLLPKEDANKFSRVVAVKVELARLKIKNEIEIGGICPFSRLRSKGDPYFSTKEINALAAVSKFPEVLIEMSELGTLEEAIEKLYLDNHIKNTKAKALGDNSKKVFELIGEILND